MEIVLIRHGEPEWVRDGLNVVDPPLTERGHRQAEQVAVALEGEVFDEIVISPLRRPQLTAAPSLARRGADLVIECELPVDAYLDVLLDEVMKPQQREAPEAE